MRHIDNRQIVLPDGWIEKSQAAHDEVEAGTCKIKDRASVWAELKGALAVLSHDKCWYCEAKQERSDDAVDHFRPKNSLADCVAHNGYTWLAFSQTNFRYSCTFCNNRRKNIDGITKGKGDYFPLIDENNRWYRSEDKCCEDPKAIDPCVAGESSWLDWRENGVPVPKHSNQEPQNTKAKCAIYLYHLDHQGACEDRRSIAIDIKSWVKEAHASYLQFGNEDNAAKVNWSNRCRDIVKAMSPSARYSAFARRVVMMLRSEANWLDDLLQEM